MMGIQRRRKKRRLGNQETIRVSKRTIEMVPFK